MAGEDQDNQDKTEDPSQYRLEKSKEKGDVVSSKDLSGIMIVGAAVGTLMFAGTFMLDEIWSMTERILALNLDTVYQQKEIITFMNEVIYSFLKIISPLFLIVMIVSFLSQVMQIGVVYAPDLISMKLERINPQTGFGRIFSSKSLFEFFKGLIKFVLVFGVTYMVLNKSVFQLNGMINSEISSSLIFMKAIVFRLFVGVLITLVIIALIDFTYEKWAYLQRMKMSKHEMKEELKEREGSPEIRSRIKSVQREMAKKRMMKDLPKADVVVTNPTHFSVALKYNRDSMVAPIVIAKGADHLAFQIREIAKKNDIPLVENVMLARTLYSTVKVGESVPRDLYKAVAEVLAFVYKLKKRATWKVS
ncbi:MAG: flagellar biosynthesis protein FlhB [Bacteriovoracaceae bacterium]|nr:flagellar biosynthesis protein FlhB [Bacteriovoracaceae bacterium]